MAIQNKSIDYLRVDINSGQVMKKIYVRQNDTVPRTLSISLMNEGLPLDISEALFVEILIKKPDGYEADNGCVVVGNEVQYTLRSTDINVVGDSTAQVLVTYSDGTTLTTPSFTIVTYAQEVSTKVVASMNEYTSITQQLVQVNNLYNLTASAKTQTENLLAETQVVKADTEALRDETEGYRDDALASENNAKTSETNASTSEANALVSENNAKTSETNAKTSEDNAQTYMINALSSKNASALSESNAQTYMNNALSSKNASALSESKAKTSETNSKTSEDNALSHSVTAESWAVGGTGTRTGEDTNNAEYWCRQAKEAVSGDYLAKDGDASNVYVGFTEDTTDVIASGDKLSVLFGKIKHGISNLTSHISNTSNPHSVTKAQVGLGNCDNTSDLDKPISTAQSSVNTSVSTSIGDMSQATTTATNLVGMINEVNALAKGRMQAVAYATYQSMITALNAMSGTEYVVGQNIYIGTVGVPDLWIYSIESTSVPYTYVDDDTFASALKTAGSVQVGIYKVAQLETQKVDLTSVTSRLDALELAIQEMHYPK